VFLCVGDLAVISCNSFCCSGWCQTLSYLNVKRVIHDLEKTKLRHNRV
jgi:hypothetical protein